MSLLFVLAGFSVIAVASSPAPASGAGWDIDPAGGEFPLTFTVSGGQNNITVETLTINCTKISGTGKYTAATAGKIEITFSGCIYHNFLGPEPCTTPGQASGNITTTELEFHNVYLEPNAKNPGVLITPREEHFATYKCMGAQWALSGNGLLGALSSPGCGSGAETAAWSFESSAAGIEKWMQIETTGTKFDTTSKTGGGGLTTSFDAMTTLTFEKEATMTC